MNKYWGIMILCGGAMLWQGCRKDPLNHLSNEESRIYITQYDTLAKFTTYKTFSVSDSVALLINGQNVGMELGTVENAFIQSLDSAMEKAGYTLVPRESSPDLAINLTHISTNYAGVTYFSDYGDYWDPYYWGYGYGYAFPYYYAAYQVGEDALAFDLFDLKNATANKQLKDIWSALIKGEDIFVQANVSAEVSALFAQSTYLKSSPS
jgi:hypothetical protein